MVMVQVHVMLILQTPIHFHPFVAILDVHLTAKKLPSKAYPKELATIGDRVRKRRLDLTLTQKEVADIIRVNEMTIVNWELNHCQPLRRNIPKIIDFLGYVPQDLFPAGNVG